MIPSECYVHSTPTPGCPDCMALRNSLKLIYADIEATKIRAQMEPLKAEWAGRDMARDGAPLSLAEMVEDIERWVKGDVS